MTRQDCRTRHCPNRALAEFGLVVCSECVTKDAALMVAVNYAGRLKALEKRVATLEGVLTP
jgi:hypothetical protein